MNAVLFQIAGWPVTAMQALAASGGAILLLFLVVLATLRAAAARSRVAEEEAAARAEELELRLGELMRLQGEMTGRMQTIAEVFGARQSDLVSGLNERLDRFGHRLGQTVSEATKNTHESLTHLAERLAVIDTAQKNITELSREVVSLQQVLANKQTRGAFGQARMEAIVADGLPMGGYAFQATLSNGTRPDCVVFFPNGAPMLVVDAKFPLEGWNAIRAADGPETVKAAETQFRRDVGKHVRDIAERYLIAGETQDTAFMFVPSESVFADIHERFEDLVQAALRARVVIVSPSLLMLSIQVMQAVLKDVRMREQAHLIQREVAELIKDVGRLNERVGKLQSHFGQASRDIDDILVSTRKLASRGEKIAALDLGEEIERERQPDLLAGA